MSEEVRELKVPNFTDFTQEWQLDSEDPDTLIEYSGLLTSLRLTLAQRAGKTPQELHEGPLTNEVSHPVAEAA